MYRLIYCHAVKPRTVKSIGGVSVKLVNSYVACQVSTGLTGQFKSRFLGLCVTLHEEELGGEGGHGGVNRTMDGLFLNHTCECTRRDIVRLGYLHILSFALYIVYTACTG